MAGAREVHHEAQRLGRPRCLETRDAILATAATMLETLPYRDISVEKIAAAAGVGKQTIYRWYSCKAALMLEAYMARHAQALPPPRPGEAPLAALRTYLHQLVAVLPTPIVERAYRVLFAEAQHDAAFRRRFDEAVLGQRRAVVKGLLAAAMRSGELRPDADAELLCDLLLSPILARFLTGAAPPDAAFADALLDAVLAVAALRTRHAA